MAYKHTFNRDYNYLVHFNKNHDPKNGRFTFGDGDGDGVIGERQQKQNFNEFKKNAVPGWFKKGKGTDSYNLSEDYNQRKQDAINKAKSNITVDDLDIDREIDNQFGKYADTKIVGLRTGDSARSFIKNLENESIKNAVDQKLLKENGYEKEGWGDEGHGNSFFWYKKNVNGAEVIIDSADEIKFGNAVADSIKAHKGILDKEKDRILKDELKSWGDNDLTKSHTKGFKLKTVTVFGDSDTAEANYWYDGPGDPLGGHEISIEFDIKTGKPRGYAING